jgi:lysyl-tRNA synthetase class 2
MRTSVENLRRRAAIVREIRAFFDTRGFDEVSTPVRIAAPAPEPHIDCPASGDAFLRASPELQMKKLLAMGMDRIYQIGPCFREGERGSRHSPEFTMIEWYRRCAGYLDIAHDMEELFAALAPKECRPTRMTVRDAYIRYAGWDPWLAWDQDRFDFDMATKIEPSLPKGAVFLMDYPREAASLAKIRGDVAERWEFYWKGIELANCFTELCDEAEQRRRFEVARDERRALGEADYPLDEGFLKALPLIESASGVALGIDRLVMLLAGEREIASVMSEE